MDGFEDPGQPIFGPFFFFLRLKHILFLSMPSISIHESKGLDLSHSVCVCACVYVSLDL